MPRFANLISLGIAICTLTLAFPAHPQSTSEKQNNRKAELKKITVQLPELLKAPQTFVDRRLYLSNVGLSKPKSYTNKRGDEYYLAIVAFGQIQTLNTYSPDTVVFIFSPEMALAIQKSTPELSGPGFDLRPAASLWFRMGTIESNSTSFYVAIVDCVKFLGEKGAWVGNCTEYFNK